uniref:Endonuclease domain containing 1 n=1 Tax=Sphenodon punctatus TaxID=8508 RepID=A0A8D0GGZ0_SPHPU
MAQLHAAPLCLLLPLLAGLSQGRVVGSDEPGFAECNAFFSGQSPPEGFADGVKLCQRYNEEPRFATLYSPEHKTPLYSAFRCSQAAPGAEESWLLEPQIDDPENDLEGMMPEADIAGSVKNLGANQALTADYEDSGYEKGQLNPSSLHKDDFRRATYTLTNAVPMPQPVSESWHREVETVLVGALAPHCENGGGLYLVAGAVPSSRRVKAKVSVPDFLWLAACCEAPQAWSLGFVKQMTDSSSLEGLTVEEIEKQLPAGVRLFKNCGKDSHDPKKMEEVLQAVEQVQAEAPISQAKESTLTHQDGGAEQQEESSLLRKVLGLIIAPFVKLLQIVFYLLVQILTYTFYFVRYVVQQAIQGVLTYLQAIGMVLLSIPSDVARVIAIIAKGTLRIIQNIVLFAYRILSIPVEIFIHIVSFPFYTLCAIPGVIQDIISGIFGTFLMIFDATASILSAVNYVAVTLAKRFIPKISSDA